MSDTIQVEVVYALPHEQTVVSLEVRSGTTVAQAIELSGLAAKYPQLTLGRDNVGIYGRRVELSDWVRDGDRIEIYRPLIADPKEARRTRSRAGTRSRATRRA
jgi:putative ubiquitin-RnfH superfamily antitoxin RatB of RatAB toxin-antitoxin module